MRILIFFHAHTTVEEREMAKLVGHSIDELYMRLVACIGCDGDVWNEALVCIASVNFSPLNVVLDAFEDEALRFEATLDASTNTSTELEENIESLGS
jgi:hypothetical protein